MERTRGNNKIKEQDQGKERQRPRGERETELSLLASGDWPRHREEWALFCAAQGPLEGTQGPAPTRASDPAASHPVTISPAFPFSLLFMLKVRPEV